MYSFEETTDNAFLLPSGFEDTFSLLPLPSFELPTKEETTSLTPELALETPRPATDLFGILSEQNDDDDEEEAQQAYQRSKNKFLQTVLASKQHAAALPLTRRSTSCPTLYGLRASSSSSSTHSSSDSERDIPITRPVSAPIAIPPAHKPSSPVDAYPSRRRVQSEENAAHAARLRRRSDEHRIVAPQAVAPAAAAASKKLTILTAMSSEFDAPLGGEVMSPVEHDVFDFEF